jgi:hypothetical protein
MVTMHMSTITMIIVGVLMQLSCCVYTIPVMTWYAKMTATGFIPCEVLNILDPIVTFLVKNLGTILMDTILITNLGTWSPLRLFIISSIITICNMSGATMVNPTLNRKRCEALAEDGRRCKCMTRDILFDRYMCETHLLDAIGKK